MKKITTRFLTALLALAAVPGLLVVSGCAAPLPVVCSAVAPDGKHRADILAGGADGDATVGFFREVVLCKGSGECQSGSTLDGATGDGFINVWWKSNDHLLVYYSPMATTVHSRHETKDGIKIDYVPQGK